MKAMQRWVFTTFLMWFLAWVPATEAQIVQASVFEDESAAMTIDEVTNAAFTPMGDTLARGYTESALWVRLVLAAHENSQYLRVRPPYLDHVTLYRPDGASPTGWFVSENGDRVPMQDRRVWGVSLLFALPPIDSEQTVYLRAQTQSSSLMNVEVMTLPEFQQKEFHTMLLQLLMIAIMLGILIWAALDFVVSRQRIVGVFLLVQIFQIGYVLAIAGYLPLMFSLATVADQVTSVLIGLVVLITLIFHRLLVAGFEPNKWALRVLNTMITLSALAVVTIVFGQLQFGLPLNSYIVLLLMPVLPWLAFTAKRECLPGRITLRVTYVALAGLLFFVMAPIFGIWVSFDMYLLATTAQGSLTGLIMATFLFRRSSALQQRFFADQLELARVEEKLVAQQLLAADQRQFLDMLAHELKTPLGVMQLTLESVALSDVQQKRLHRSLDTMSAVIDRCRLSLQLDEGRLTPRLETVEISVTIKDLVSACKEPERVVLVGRGPFDVRTDQQLFIVVVHNLLDNAMKYSPQDTAVTVTMQPHELESAQGVLITVHNRVTSVPAQQPEILFEKYSRGKNATGHTGSGLGLHLSRRLAVIINGHLWADLGQDDIKVCLWLPN